MNPTRKENRVIQVNLAGGILGMLSMNPRKTLEKRIQKANADGWSVVQVEPQGTANLVMMVLQLIVLLLTLLLWTFGGAYLVFLEREVGGTS